MVLVAPRDRGKGEILPVQSVAVGSEKQSWIVFKLVVRELQVVPSHLAANTKTNQSIKCVLGGLTGLVYLPGSLEGWRLLRMILQYRGEMVSWPGGDLL